MNKDFVERKTRQNGQYTYIARVDSDVFLQWPPRPNSARSGLYSPPLCTCIPSTDVWVVHKGRPQKGFGQLRAGDGKRTLLTSSN